VISIIRFKDLERWKNVSKWVLVYGRRKTGKSYFVKNNVKWDKYYFVGRSGDIFVDDEKIGYETFIREAIQNLENEKTIVIDEIQRLPEEFFDLLHNIGVKGKLIAITSTIWLTKSLLGKRSPLLGLFSE
jgi:predicted AAA+ superfamily ATPase